MSYQTFFVLSLLNFCSLFQSKQKTVFGRDNRKEVGTPTSDGIVINYPYNTVTQVITPQGTCSGSLVSRCLVLTNFHCISDSQGLKGPIRVEVGYTQGKSVRGGYATYAWWSNKVNFGDSYGEFVFHDWALLKIDSCPGEKVGWLATGVLNGNSNIPVDIIGYANDKNNTENMITAPCNIRGKENNPNGQDFLFEHDCDVSPGTSGSPIKVTYQGTEYVVALQTGESVEGNQRLPNGTEYDPSKANFAVPVSSFQGVLTALLQNDKSL